MEINPIGPNIFEVDSFQRGREPLLFRDCGAAGAGAGDADGIFNFYRRER